MRSFCDIAPRIFRCRHRCWVLLLLLVSLLLQTGEARAARSGNGQLSSLQQTWGLCQGNIAAAERLLKMPQHILTAISIVESGRWNEEAKRTQPWPWTVMAEGRGRFLPTRAAAIAEVRRLQARGVRNIDVGCMQINLRYHGEAFASLKEAFEPANNVAYGAAFLQRLKQQHNSWQKAIGYYHSATPERSGPYRLKVVKTWNDVRR